MKHFVYIGLLLIFLSMILILSVFISFSAFLTECIQRECDSNNVFFNMIFGFFISGIFVIIDMLVIYFLYKERPWESGSSHQVYKSAKTKIKTGNKLSELKDELNNLNQAKEETEKQYYKGKFDAQTFENMLNKYEQRIIEVKTNIKGMKTKKEAKNEKA